MTGPAHFAWRLTEVAPKTVREMGGVTESGLQRHVDHLFGGGFEQLTGMSQTLAQQPAFRRHPKLFVEQLVEFTL